MNRKINLFSKSVEISYFVSIDLSIHIESSIHHMNHPTTIIQS